MNRFLAPFLALLGSFLALSQAQSAYPNQSAPFNLVLVSASNSSINNQLLGACHSGALIQSLCIYPGIANPSDPFNVFYFNASTADANINTASMDPGLLTWTTTVNGGTAFVNLAMTLLTNPASDLAFPMIWPSIANQQPVVFTDNNLLAVPAYTDDTATPPGPFATAGGVRYLDNRWALCNTYWTSYRYTALQWVLGDGEPQNPSCQSVSVKRVFL